MIFIARPFMAKLMPFSDFLLAIKYIWRKLNSCMALSFKLSNSWDLDLCTKSQWPIEDTISLRKGSRSIYNLHWLIKFMKVVSYETLKLVLWVGDISSTGVKTSFQTQRKKIPQSEPIWCKDQTKAFVRNDIRILCRFSCDLPQNIIWQQVLPVSMVTLGKAGAGTGVFVDQKVVTIMLAWECKALKTL